MGTPGSRFYLVNDRPVAVLPVLGGGTDCVVFDWVTGELVPDRSYFGYVTPGSGKDVDALTEAQFQARLAACRVHAAAVAVAELRTWAQRLCSAAGEAGDLAAALVPFQRDHVMQISADLPPRGYRRVRIGVHKEHAGRSTVELSPAGRLLTREVLDAGFHAERELPIPPDSWLEGFVAYRSVTVAGAPARCGMTATFRHGAAEEIRLSREPSR
jgi:hypothetical protein